MERNYDGWIAAGATAQTVYAALRNTDGTPATGLVHNTNGLFVAYTRIGAAAVTVTKVAQTVAGAWVSGGFVEVDATSAPGLYRIDVPNAAFATGADAVTLTVVRAGVIQPWALTIPLLPPVALYGTAGAGATTVSVPLVGLPTLSAGQLNRRPLQVLSGAAAGERVLIVGQASNGTVQVAPPLTIAPSAGDRVVVV